MIQYKNKRLKKCAVAMAISFSSFTMAADYSDFAVMPTAFNDALNFDENGNLYIAHTGNFGDAIGTTVRKIDSFGEITDVVGGLNATLGHDFDSKGNMYIASYISGELVKVAPYGMKTVLLTLDPGYVNGVLINAQDEIFVTSYNGNVIYKVKNANENEIWLEDERFNGPVGIVMDEAGDMYVGNYNDGKVFKITNDKTITQLADIPDDGFGYITYSNGMVYASGWMGKKLYKIPTSDADYEIIEGSEEAGFKFPNGIAASKDGSKLFVSDFYTDKITLVENFSTAPKTQNDSAIAEQNSEVAINILSNDNSMNEQLDLSSISITASPKNGTTIVNSADGTITYVPNVEYIGVDSFTYIVSNNNGEKSNQAEVSINVIEPIILPQAQDDEANVQQDSEVLINILSNDNNDGVILDMSSVNIITKAQNGIVTINNDTGEITYKPDTGFSGTDSFIYTIKNTNGDVSNEANVAITVSAKQAAKTTTSSSKSSGSLGAFLLLGLILIPSRRYLKKLSSMIS